MAFIQRTGQHMVLRSDQSPSIAIQIDPEFKYAGSTSFILYEVARADQHHFVVPDSERRVLRRLWFQFEGYLENNNHILHNTYTTNIEEAYEARPSADWAHAVDFLKEKGYRLTGDIMSHRMVWLDSDHRNELMIIYSETLETTSYRPSDLMEGGPAAAEWPATSRALQERSFSVSKSYNKKLLFRQQFDLPRVSKRKVIMSF